MPKRMVMKMRSRIRKVRSEREYEEVIDEYVTTGYRIKERGEKTANLIKPNYGGVASHVLIFLLIGWWTIFAANIIWLIYNYYTNSEEVLLKIISPHPQKEN